MSLICASVPALRSFFKGTFRGSSEEQYNSHELSHTHGTLRSKKNITPAGKTQRTLAILASQRSNYFTRTTAEAVYRMRVRRTSSHLMELWFELRNSILDIHHATLKMTIWGVGNQTGCKWSNSLPMRGVMEYFYLQEEQSYVSLFNSLLVN